MCESSADQPLTKLYVEFDAVSANGTNTRTTCEYAGKTYYEGERFFPEGDSCKTCYCKPGFTGKLEEPFCRDISCAIEIGGSNRLNNNCVPVYYGKEGCCPVRWKCRKYLQAVAKSRDRWKTHTSRIPAATPVVSARIKPSAANGTVTSAAKCKFGQLELNQFDEFLDNDVRCQCLAPPYLSCFIG